MCVAPIFTHVCGARRYDLIAFNYAINNDKSRKLLVPGTGRLLAPINNQQDYWLQQTYFIIDSDLHILFNATTVGAWDVLFQPDVTQDFWQGIWCQAYNGFKPS